MIDPNTGEIENDSQQAFSPVYFKEIAEAEDALFGLEETGGEFRLRQVQILNAIRDGELFKQKINPKTNKHFNSMEEYYPLLLHSLSSYSTDAPRTLKSWMSRWRIFVEQLDRNPESLLEYGSHYEVMLPLAARNPKTLELSQQDEPIEETGGKKLSQDNFTEFVTDIERRINEMRANPGVDELSWKVRQTKEMVQDVLGKTETDVRQEWTAAWAGQNTVRLEKLVIWHNGRPYKLGDLVPYDVFLTLTKGHTVVGIEKP